MAKNFYTFSAYLKKKYPFKVQKIPVHAGFTCPTRDGTKGTRGCAYCNNLSFSPNAIPPVKPLKEQITKGMNFYKNRGVHKFIVYFQAYTNTYGDVERLDKIYSVALEFPEVVGISIGTRPDCLSDEVISLIQSYTKKVDVWLEIGAQSSHNSTLQQINRGHTFEDFVDAVNRAKNKNINLLTHLIYGLPNETWEMMMQTTRKIAGLPLHGVKIHHFYVASGTRMEELYNEGKITVMSYQEWVKLAADILERLPPKMVIHRICGELHGQYLVAPKWQISKQTLFDLIEKELESRGSRQGALFCAESLI